jgi:hypothetical protein
VGGGEGGKLGDQATRGGGNSIGTAQVGGLGGTFRKIQAAN